MTGAYYGLQCPIDDWYIMTSNVKALDGCSSHHLQGAGHIVSAPLQATRLVHIAFTDCDTYGSQNTTTSHQKRYDYFIQPQRYNYTSD